MSKAGFQSLTLTILLVVTSCVTSNDAKFYETSQVIEKSKIKEPQWIRRTIGSLAVTEFEMSSVDYQKDILNLPDGIRSSQTAALESLYLLMIDYFFAELTDIAISENLDLAGKVWLKKDIESALRPLHKDRSKIKDIYYEKIRDNSQTIPEETYRVFVLTVFPKEAEKSFFRNLQRRFKSSRDPLKVKLSKILNR